MKTTEEKIERIKEAWNSHEHHKLIFEWVKTGNLSLKEFTDIINQVSQWDEDESRTLWG